MSAAHLHLALNHIPVLGTLFGILLLAYGHWRDQLSLQKATLGFLVGIGAVAVAVYLTGEPAEEVVEGVAGVSHEALELHEEWGWYAVLASSVTGVAALGALLYGWIRQSLPRWTVRAVFVLALLTGGIMVYTANLGGKVHHPELRSDATVVQSPDAGGQNNAEGEDESDEHR